MRCSFDVKVIMSTLVQFRLEVGLFLLQFALCRLGSSLVLWMHCFDYQALLFHCRE